MRLLWVPLIAACSAGNVHEGISVGNPSLTTVTTARTGGISLESGWARLFGVAVVQEDGTLIRTDEQRRIDLLGEHMIDVPAGDWRRITLHFSGDFRYRGTTDDGEPVSLRLAVPRVDLYPEDIEVTVDGEPYLVELAFPGWLRDTGPLNDVVPDTAQHDVLAGAIHEASALYEDSDDDGQLSEEERRRRRASGRDRNEL